MEKVKGKVSYKNTLNNLNSLQKNKVNMMSTMVFSMVEIVFQKL